jgi:hypothetical protein
MASELLNAAPHPHPKEEEAHAKAAASSVWVSQSAMGPAVAQVKQSTTTSNNLYWLCLSNTETLRSLVFTVTFKAGSPLTDQVQTFNFPSGYAGSVTTPFGVPFWGGNPILGAATLRAQTNVGTATYNFTVVA